MVINWLVDDDAPSKKAIAQALRAAPLWLPERIVLLTRTGSHAYGTATAGSDEDFRGVVVAPRDYYMGFSKSFERFVFDGDTEGEIEDLRVFLRAACNGEPQVLAPLFCAPCDVLVATETGCALRGAQRRFLSKRMVKPFAGHARSIITGWGDTDRRHTHAEFPRMVTGWLNEGQQRGKRWISAFDLSFVDADMTIPIKAFTGNVVVKSYSAAFRRAVPRSHTRRLAEWRAIIAKAEAEYRGGVGTPATTGARIQAARENLAMPRAALGEIVGLSKAHVGAIERDARHLTPDRAAQFERALSLGDGELTQ